MGDDVLFLFLADKTLIVGILSHNTPLTYWWGAATYCDKKNTLLNWTHLYLLLSIGTETRPHKYLVKKDELFSVWRATMRDPVTSEDGRGGPGNIRRGLYRPRFPSGVAWHTVMLVLLRYNMGGFPSLFTFHYTVYGRQPVKLLFNLWLSHYAATYRF